MWVVEYGKGALFMWTGRVVGILKGVRSQMSFRVRIINLIGFTNTHSPSHTRHDPVYKKGRHLDTLVYSV